ncbi:MAG: hypothetical protein QXV52_08480 [Nitrososphaeria archaeon]
MPAATKFNIFVEHLTNKVHDLFGVDGSGTNPADSLKLYLSNATPNVSTHTVKADIAEIATGNGYGGPIAVQNSGSRSGGTFTLTGVSFTITASGGTIPSDAGTGGRFRYFILFNDTPTNPADPLILYWDYGSSIYLNAGESFTVKFNGAAVGSAGTIFTLS